MYSFCKWYESVFERHAISCIVFCAISFLILLFLFLIPSGEVFASENNGSSASTSVIQGDSENDNNIDDVMALLGESESGSKCYLVHDTISHAKQLGVSYINLSDIFTLNGTVKENPYYTYEQINSMLEEVPLIFANEFYSYSSYQFRVLEVDEETVVFTVSNCSDQMYYSNDVGLIHMPPDGGNSVQGLIDFSKSDFINETIVYNPSSKQADFYIGYNLDISQYFGFHGIWEDWETFEGPFYWNSQMILSKWWSADYPYATDFIYVYDGQTIQFKSFDDVIDGHNGFLNVGESAPETGEDTTNNLYLDGCSWNFQNIPRKYLNQNSNLYFQTTGLNDYQLNHLQDFYLNYDFKIEVTVDYKTFLGFHTGGGGGHSFGTSASNYHFSDYLQNHTNNLMNIYSSFLNGANIKIPNRDKFTFYFVNPQDNTSFYRQTLEQFHSSGDKCTFFTRDYLFSNCYGLARIDEDGTKYNCSFSNYIYSLDSLYDDWSISDCVITCNARIFDIQGSQGGNCKSSYNFVNGAENRIDTSLSYNDNPYYQNDGVGVATGSNANSNSSVINSGNININNNPSIVINNENNQNNDSSSSGDDTIIIKLVKLIFGDNSLENQDSISPDTSGILDWFGVNRWVQVLNNTFTFIPQSIFTMISIYFGAVLLILLAAFVLKIIVEFL